MLRPPVACARGAKAWLAGRRIDAAVHQSRQPDDNQSTSCRSTRSVSVLRSRLPSGAPDAQWLGNRSGGSLSRGRATVPGSIARILRLALLLEPLILSGERELKRGARVGRTVTASPGVDQHRKRLEEGRPWTAHPLNAPGSRARGRSGVEARHVAGERMWPSAVALPPRLAEARRQRGNPAALCAMAASRGRSHLLSYATASPATLG